MIDPLVLYKLIDINDLFRDGQYKKVELNFDVTDHWLYLALMGLFSDPDEHLLLHFH